MNKQPIDVIFPKIIYLKIKINLNIKIVIPGQAEGGNGGF